MSEHEPMNESGNGREGTTSGARPEPSGDEPTPSSSEPVRSTSPRDLAKQVWGSWPSLPAGAAPPSAPPPSPPPWPRPPLEPAAEVEFDETAEDELDADLLAIEDRLGGTEERLEALMSSTQRSLAALGETIRSSTQNLPSVIEGAVERRLSTVGDALLKLADLRARLQEETTEAVQSLRSSFESLEERLLATTQERVEASIDRLTTELPTRADFASVRGAVDSVASALHGELAVVLESIARIEQTIASPPVDLPPPAER